MENRIFADEADVEEALKNTGYEVQEFLDSCQYFLVFYLIDNDTMNIVHVISYINKPTENDIVSAYEELATDDEFGLLECSDDLNHFVNTRDRMQQDFPEVLEVQ